MSCVIVKEGTKQADRMVWEWENCFKGDDIDKAYGKCSKEKRDSFKSIWFRATQTKGYNHDLKIIHASSWRYSTMYTYTDGGSTYLVKDTEVNTFVLKLR